MSTVTEIEARKARAVELLTEWLREDDPIFGLLDEIREAVEHWSQCDGTNYTCADTTDECETTPADACRYCATPCEDCEYYRKGYNGLWSGRAPTLELVDELTMRLERREEERAS